MIHLLASLFFSLLAIAAFGMVSFMLGEARPAILRALGFAQERPALLPASARRIRIAARPGAEATRPLPSRAAA